MLLKNKIIVVYGATGAVGSAVARAFAREGATLHLTGRTQTKLQALAAELAPSDSAAVHVHVVDAMDEKAVEAHLQEIAGRHGRIDVSFNAIGIPQEGVQGISLLDLPVASFMKPVITYSQSHYVTMRAAARVMVLGNGGVILLHTPEPARTGAPLVGGMGPAWAAMEGLVRDFSLEFAPQGVRVLGLRTTGLPETPTIATVFGLHAKALGIPPEQFLALMEGMSHHRRSTKLDELARAAVFAASDLAGGFYGTVLNLTGGKSPD